MQVVLFGFQGNQLVAHVGLLDLGSDDILLCRQAAGIAYLGDFFQAGHQVEDFPGQLLIAVHVIKLGEIDFDPPGHIGPCAQRTTLGAVGFKRCNLSLQVALAEPGNILHQQVTGAADATRGQGCVLLAESGDVAQLGTKLRVGQGAGRRHPLARRFGLGLHRSVFRIARLGVIDQAIDVRTEGGLLGKHGSAKGDGKRQDQNG